MTNTVLITGGAGFIGSHLVDALLPRGYRVRVYDNLEPQVHASLRERGEWPAYLQPGTERILGDVRDRDALRLALQGVDTVFHLAALVGVGQSMVEVERYVDVNLRGTSVLLDILANERHGVRKLIVPGSVAAYGDGAGLCPSCGVVFPFPRSEAQLRAGQWETCCPQCGHPLAPQPSREDHPVRPSSVYALTKYGQEQLCLAVGRSREISTVALRYFNVYGPRQAPNNPYTGVMAIFGQRLLEGYPARIHEDGQQTRDFVHVADVIQANLLAMDWGQDSAIVLNISGGVPVSIQRMADLLGQALGKEIAPDIPGTFRSGDVRHSWADITRAREILGYTPHISLEVGTRDLAAWLLGSRAG